MSEPDNPALIALKAVLADAAEFIDVAPEDVRVTHIEAREWPDGCLGLPAEGEACTEAITPGFEIRAGAHLWYRADHHGTVRREVRKPGVDGEVWVKFVQTGGIGGWRSEFRGVEGESLDQGVAEKLRLLVEEANFFDLPKEVANGTPIPDLYSYEVTIGYSRRSVTVGTYDGSGPLAAPQLAPILALLKSIAPAPGPLSTAVVE